MNRSQPSPPTDRFVRIRQRVRQLLIVGFLSMAAAVVAFGFATGFGEVKITAICLATMLGTLAIFDARLAWTSRILVALIAGYLAALSVELLLFFNDPKSRTAKVSLQHLHTRDPETGYRLTANFRGIYDDGVRRVRYETNSLGHRDTEPGGSSSRRVLLVGDSFTFGLLLDQDESIDKQLEALSDGQIDAYNLGVMGFGPLTALTMLRRCELAASHAFYLFFENDLRNDGMLADLGHTVVDGYLVESIDALGNPRSAAELQEAVRLAVKEALRSKSLGLFDRLKLRTIRNRLRSALRSTEFDTSGTGLLAFDPANVEKAVACSVEMHEVAKARGSQFCVVIVPSMSSVERQEYPRLVRDYVDGVRATGIPILELLPRLSRQHYIAHDGHFNAAGAGAAAQALLEYLRK